MLAPGWVRRSRAQTGSRAMGMSHTRTRASPQRAGRLGGCSGPPRRIFPPSFVATITRTPRRSGQPSPQLARSLARQSIRQDHFQRHWCPHRRPMNKQVAPKKATGASHADTERRPETPPCRPPLRRHQDSGKQTSATEFVVACTSPTRASASSVSTQSDIPLTIAGRALSTPRPTKLRAALVLPKPTNPTPMC